MLENKYTGIPSIFTSKVNWDSKPLHSNFDCYYACQSFNSKLSCLLCILDNDGLHWQTSSVAGIIMTSLSERVTLHYSNLWDTTKRNCKTIQFLIWRKCSTFLRSLLMCIPTLYYSDANKWINFISDWFHAHILSNETSNIQIHKTPSYCCNKYNQAKE